MRVIPACVFAVAASLAGCAGTGDVEYSGQVQVSSPELVEISPGVQVIADADEPLFYSDGSYWLYRDGYWLHSDDYRSGFVRIDLAYVPQRVRVIDRPQVYVQYSRYHQRDIEARTRQQNTRSRPAPQGTYYPTRPYPPAANPTLPAPTPPYASPNDIHGNPMPPRQMPPINVDRSHDDRGPERAPPGQTGRPIPPPPPQTQRPDDHDDRDRARDDKGHDKDKARGKDKKKR